MKATKKLLMGITTLCLTLGVSVSAFASEAALYKFDGNWKNSVDASQVGTPSAAEAGVAPSLATDSERGKVAKFTLGFQADKKQAQVSVPNPLKGADLSNGATISVWVKGAKTDFTNWESLWTVKADGKGMAWLAGAPYFGFNNGDNWGDLNAAHDEITKDKIDYLANNKADKWTLVTTTITKDGATIYVDGEKFLSTNDAAYVKTNGTGFAGAIDVLSSANTIELGGAAFWGSCGFLADDFAIYNKALTAAETKQLLSGNQVDAASTTAATTTSVETKNSNPATGDAGTIAYALTAAAAVGTGIFAAKKRRK